MGQEYSAVLERLEVEAKQQQDSLQICHAELSSNLTAMQRHQEAAQVVFVIVAVVITTCCTIAAAPGGWAGRCVLSCLSVCGMDGSVAWMELAWIDRWHSSIVGVDASVALMDGWGWMGAGMRGAVDCLVRTSR